MLDCREMGEFSGIVHHRPNGCVHNAFLAVFDDGGAARCSSTENCVLESP